MCLCVSVSVCVSVCLSPCLCVCCRRLGPSERPLQMVFDYLSALGFREPARVQQEANNSDLSCMIRFYSGECTHTHTHTHAHTHKQTHTTARTHARTHTHKHAQPRARTACTHAHTNAHTHKHTQTSIKFDFICIALNHRCSLKGLNKALCLFSQIIRSAPSSYFTI